MKEVFWGDNVLRFNFLKSLIHFRQLKLKEFISIFIIGDVLDFGCGTQDMKQFCKYYTGYDVRDEYSDVRDYKKVWCETIIANNSLEHLTKEELHGFIQYAKDKRLICVIPKDNDFLISFLYKNDLGHLISEKYIVEELRKNFKIIYDKTSLFTQRIIIAEEI